MHTADVPPRARHSDPITSHEAGEAIVKHITRIQRNILLWADRVGPGEFIDLELEKNFQDFGATHRTRRSELVELGLLKNTGTKKMLHGHDRRFIVWAITRRGSRAANDIRNQHGR